MGAAAGAAVTGISNLGAGHIQGQAQEKMANINRDASQYGADKAAETAANQLAYAKQVYGEQSNAYQQALQNAEQKAAEAGTTLDNLYSTTQSNLNTGYSNLGANLGAGYSNLGANLGAGYSNLGANLGAGYNEAIEEAGKTPEEIQTLKNDILSGNAKQLLQGRNQTAANLATSGLRGGQAATLMNRATGEQTENATKQINELLGNVANQSKAYQQALLQNKLNTQEQLGQRGLETQAQLGQQGLGMQAQLGQQGLTAQQQLGQQQLSGNEAKSQALLNFLYNPESAKYTQSVVNQQNKAEAEANEKKVLDYFNTRKGLMGGM